jgi:hypothetical protein
VTPRGVFTKAGVCSEPLLEMTDNANLASSLDKYASDDTGGDSGKKEKILFATENDSSSSPSLSKFYIAIVGLAFTILLCWGAYRQFVLEPVKQEKYENEKSKATARYVKCFHFCFTHVCLH